MKQVSEMPTSGQFVAVCQNKQGWVWSSTYKWIDGKLNEYTQPDEYAPMRFTKCDDAEYEKSFLTNLDALFFIAD